MYPRDCSFLVAIRMVPFGNPYLLGHTTQAPEREAARARTQLCQQRIARSVRHGRRRQPARTRVLRTCSRAFLPRARRAETPVQRRAKWALAHHSGREPRPRLCCPRARIATPASLTGSTRRR